MTSKEYLSQAYLLESRIKVKQEQIEVLRASTQKVTATYGTECVSHSRNVTTLEDGVISINEAQAELNNMHGEMLRLQVEISEVIISLDNQTHSMILTKRYLRYLSWNRIANEMRYTVRWVQKQHGKALKAVDQLLKSREKEAVI